MKKRILILGGSGFIGSRVSAHIRDHAHWTVVSTCHRTSRPSASGQIAIDIYEYASIYRIIKNADVVINCTGQISSPLGECIRQNTLGIQNIAMAVKRSKSRLIQLSSVSVYGTAEHVDETSPCNPETSYGAVKLGAEYLLQSKIIGKKLTIVRLCNIYGNGSKGIFGYINRETSGTHTLNFDHDGSMIRYFLHVDDAAEIIVTIAKNPDMSGIFNVAGDEKYTIKQIVNTLQKRAKNTWHIRFHHAAPKENIISIDTKKIKKYMPIKPTHSLTF